MSADIRTEIDHRYQWGFLLTEQELRRIAQSCQEHATKIGASAVARFEVKLKDGSLVESSNLDDILNLENGAHKAINRLTMRWIDSELPRALVKVEFQDGERNLKSWDSIALSIVGESRDAVFVAGADLDERVKKARVRSWPHLVSRPWFFAIPMFVATALMLITLISLLMPSRSPAEALQKEYSAGRVTNPIEALILLEREKAPPPMGRVVMAATIPGLLLFLVFGGAMSLIPKIALSYVFYWGDSIAAYDKRKRVHTIFWTVIVLGVVASLIAGGIQHFLLK